MKLVIALISLSMLASACTSSDDTAPNPEPALDAAVQGDADLEAATGDAASDSTDAVAETATADATVDTTPAVEATTDVVAETTADAGADVAADTVSEASAD